MPLTYAQIRTFNAVVREGSFTAAARALGVSQPAVTAQIKSIEETYDVQLFERSSKKLISTELALMLFATTERVDDVERDAEEILTAFHGLEKGELRIVGNATQSMMEILAVYSRRHPGVRISARNIDDGSVIQTIEERKADVAVMTNSPDGDRFVTVPFRRHRLTALVLKGHPAYERGTITLSELSSEAVIARTDQSDSQRVFSNALLAQGMTSRSVLTVESCETMLSAVSAGIGVGIMFEGAVASLADMRHLQITGIAESAFEDVVCLRLHARRRSIAAFLAIARELAED